MVIAILLICFLLNIIIHSNILIGTLNTLLLFLSIAFYLKSSQQKLSSIRTLNFISPLIFLIGVIPIFSHNYNIFVVLLAIGICALLLLYFSISRFKNMLIFIILFYILVASLYANELIKLPFSLQSNQLIFSDNWVNLYISQMQNEALYVPYKIRLLLFNGSVYFYVLLLKMTSLYTFKNLYDILLIANLYPLIKGFILDLKDWNKSKTLIILCMILISFITVISRRVDTFNTFVLLSPFLMYFILKGFKSINKITYIILFILSIIIATTPNR